MVQRSQCSAWRSRRNTSRSRCLLLCQSSCSRRHALRHSCLGLRLGLAPVTDFPHHQIQTLLECLVALVIAAMERIPETSAEDEAEPSACVKRRAVSGLEDTEIDACWALPFCVVAFLHPASRDGRVSQLSGNESVTLYGEPGKTYMSGIICWWQRFVRQSHGSIAR